MIVPDLQNAVADLCFDAVAMLRFGRTYRYGFVAIRKKQIDAAAYRNTRERTHPPHFYVGIINCFLSGGENG